MWYVWHLIFYIYWKATVSIECTYTAEWTVIFQWWRSLLNCCEPLLLQKQKKNDNRKKMLLMSCCNYTYYSTLWVWKQPINRWGCTLWGWCAPNSPLGCTESHNISVRLPPRPSVFVFRPSFFFFTPLVARTAEWQSRCCKDHVVSGKVSSI